MTDSNTWTEISPGDIADATVIMGNFNYLKDSITTTQGNISNKESISNKNTANGYCGLDSSGKVTQSLSTNVINEVKTTILNILYPVGSIYISTTSTCPLANLFGAWTLVSAGKALWTGNGQAGSGTTTQSNYANAKANTTIAAGLPNITGSEQFDDNQSGWLKGAFSRNTSKTGNGPSGGGTDCELKFDASKSNTIYGKSNTVQPPAYVVNVWRRTA